MAENLSIGMVKLNGCRCGRCWHEWIPEKKDVKPRQCAKCKSAYWDVERTLKTKTTTKNLRTAKHVKKGH